MMQKVVHNTQEQMEYKKGDDKRNGAKDSTRYPEANEVQKAAVYIEKRQYP
jgi:hypothetical protein